MKVIPATAFVRATLEALSLTGEIPASAIQADPRITYTAYVPEAHYPQANDTTTKLPLLVAVHGTGRESNRFIEIWKPFADAHKIAIVAPLFPNFLQGPLDVDGYHFLGRGPPYAGEPADTWLGGVVDVPGQPEVVLQPTNPDRDLRFDLLVLDLVTEISTRWPAIDSEKFFLHGFSGGGQFAHRFFYLHPERLAGLAVGAPGSITSIDYNQTWPTGLKNWEEIFAQPIDVEKLKKVPALGAVGSNDVNGDGTRLRLNVPGSNFGTPEEASLTRVDRLKMLIQSWEDAGLNASAVIVDGPEHEMEKVNPAFEEFLEPLVASWWKEREARN